MTMFDKTYRHKKTGNEYMVLKIGLLESTLEPVVVYTGTNVGDPVWVRPVSEFFDGRYEVLDFSHD